jgi:molybdopterin-guanine dinucleotide biosynthesis protein A
MRRGAIILCGGKSTRMGAPKLALPFGEETMLARVVRLAGEVCEVIVVVKAAAEQVLPELEREVIVACDRVPERGPLAGVAAGLAALPADVPAAFVTTCDAPLLVPKAVAWMFSVLDDREAVVPEIDGRLQPLSAVYRASVLARCEAALAANRLRLRDLFDELRARRVSEAELRAVDPRLDTVRNVNDPDEYLAALAECGFAATGDVLARLAVRRE